MPSYGRASAIFQWAETNFSYFDAWCCVRGIDPLELPAYRFYNLAIYCLKDDKTEEGLRMIDQNLAICDEIKNPFSNMSFKVVTVGRASAGVLTGSTKTEDKPKYVPSWWRGDEVNAKIATSVMGEITMMTN